MPEISGRKKCLFGPRTLLFTLTSAIFHGFLSGFAVSSFLIHAARLWEAVQNLPLLRTVIFHSNHTYDHKLDQHQKVTSPNVLSAPTSQFHLTYIPRKSDKFLSQWCSHLSEAIPYQYTKHVPFSGILSAPPSTTSVLTPYPSNVSTDLSFKFILLFKTHLYCQPYSLAIALKTLKPLI